MFIPGSSLKRESTSSALPTIPSKHTEICAFYTIAGANEGQGRSQTCKRLKYRLGRQSRSLGLRLGPSAESDLCLSFPLCPPIPPKPGIFPGLDLPAHGASPSAAEVFQMTFLAPPEGCLHKSKGFYSPLLSQGLK